MKNRIIPIILAVTLTLCTLVTPTFARGKIFYDVSPEYWAYNYITTMAEEGIINGYEDNTFKPENTVLRCEFAKLLASCTDTFLILKDDIPFEDVTMLDWYAVFLMRVKDYINSYTEGGKTYFKPYKNATREDVATAIVKALGYEPAKSIKSLDSAFADSGKISAENKPYIAVAVEKNIIKGYEDRTFRPDASLTRAEAATLLFRAFGFELPEKVAYAYPGTTVETFDSITGIELTKTYTQDGDTYYEYFVADTSGEYKDFLKYIEYLTYNTQPVTITDAIIGFICNKQVNYGGKSQLTGELLVVWDSTDDKGYTAIIATHTLDVDGKPCPIYEHFPAPTLDGVIGYPKVGTRRIGADTAWCYDYGNDDEDTLLNKVIKYIELCIYSGWDYVSEENTAYGYTIYLETAFGHKMNIHLNDAVNQVWVQFVPAN